MSLFKEPFNESIQKQLKKRQDLIGKEYYTPQDISYLNSKTSWVSLKSSVNFNGNSKLAESNVLFGGLLSEDFISTKTNNVPNLLGMKPMPGITNVSIKSKGAYGSLRQAVVTFQCWDVKQLEQLEILYMRPGYTVLLEWGWSIFINNDGSLSKEIYQDNEFFSRKDVDFQDYLKILKNLVIESKGNYDFMFGYIMNYSWKLRNDGGYDCSTEIISTGEILESYKINFSAPEIIAKSFNDNGTIFSNTIKKITNPDIIEAIRKDYSQNIIRGLCSEIYQRALLDPDISSLNYVHPSSSDPYSIDFISVDFETNKEDQSKNISSIGDNKNIYITLRDFIDLMNNFVLIKNPNNSKQSNIVSLSVKERNKSINGINEPLKCLYNPLQISVDPTICLIKNPNFYPLVLSNKPKNNKITYDVKEATQSQKSIVTYIKNNINQINKDDLKNYLLKNINNLDTLLTIDNEYSKTYSESLYSILKTKLDNNEINTLFSYNFPPIYNGIDTKPIIPTGFNTTTLPNTIYISKPKASQFLNLPNNIRELYIKQAQDKINKDNKKQFEEDIQNISDFNDIINKSEDNLFPYDNTNGIIGNIYINLKYLYLLSSNSSLESQDRAEKNNIELMIFLRTMLRDIQSSIGNVNNFEIYNEDNIGYIIDLNLVDTNNNIEPFKFEVGNRNSIIRDINVESYISSNQANIIAISAQSDPGKLGLENSSMIAYNRGIIDRMVSKKDIILGNQSPELKEDGFKELLSNLRTFFSNLTTKPYLYGLLGNPSLNVENIGTYKNALRDAIVFYTSIFKPNNKYKAILPSKLSFNIDGIGGIIIGNIFNISKDVFPSSYLEDNQGARLLYTVTGINQNIDNKGQWITTIEGNPFISDTSFDKKGNIILNGNPIIYDMPTFIQSYIDREDILPPPNYIDGDARYMCMSINRIFGSLTGVDTSHCARYTYSIANNFILAKTKSQKELPGYQKNEKKGDANSSVYHENLKKLGYKVIVDIKDINKTELKKRIEQSNQYQIGDIIVYWSNKPLIGNNNDGNKYGHTQIFTGGITYDSEFKSNIVDKDIDIKWACDRKYNYGYNFVYNSKNAIKPPESWNFMLFRL